MFDIRFIYFFTFSHPTNTNFRPSPIIDFTPADAAVPQQFKPTYIEPNPNGIGSNAVYAQKQEIENDNRRYTIEKVHAATVTYGNIAEKQFSFPNEQQQQYTDNKPIYIYRDPYTNENYHYTPTETHVKETPSPPPPTTATIYTNNNYNNNDYKQQYQNNDNQEYLVQSSMIVGTEQQQKLQPQEQQPFNPYRPYMSLSADKDVYLKRPGFVYDEKTGYKHPNSFTDKKNEAIKDKISYDSHDYPPPSYSQQETSNFLPTPVPATSKPKPPSLSTSAIQPFRQDFKATSQPWIFGQQQKPPQQHYLQSSLQSTSLPNYANNIDNYLLNKQPSADYYRTEKPPPSSYLQKQQQPQLQLQYEYDYDTRPSPYQQQQQQQQYDSRPPSPPIHHSQYPSYENVRPPPQSPPPSYFNSPQSQYPSYENVRPSSPPPSYLNAQQMQYPSYENVRPTPPPPGRPSYNNYYDYQIGEVPPSSQEQSSQHFNYPYPRPPPSQYPYQGPYRPTPAPSQHQSGLATLVQYAPQFTSLLLNGVGGGGGSSNSPLGSLLGALTGGVGGSTTPQQSLSNLNRRPVNSQLIKALENIARNDDLQCVPKVLCQMIAGQTERGQLPAFITSPAITK